MKQPAGFYTLTADCIVDAPSSALTEAAASVMKTVEQIKNMPIASGVDNPCPSSGKPKLVDPINGRIGCPEGGCWAWWSDAALERYPEHGRMSLEEAQRQDVQLSPDEKFYRTILGYVEVYIPRQPGIARPLSLYGEMGSGLAIKPSSEPIEVAAEHVPQLVLQQLGLGQGSQASQALMQGRLAALMAIR